MTLTSMEAADAANTRSLDQIKKWDKAKHYTSTLKWNKLKGLKEINDPFLSSEYAFTYNSIHVCQIWLLLPVLYVAEEVVV